MFSHRAHQKAFFLKWEKTGGEKNETPSWTKMPVQVQRGFVHVICFFFLRPLTLFFFSFFFFLSTCTYTIFMLKKCCTFFFHMHHFFFLLKNCVVFLFYLMGHNENLNKLHSSILSFFFSTKQISFLSLHFSSLSFKHRRKLNYSILSLFYHLPIFYSLTFLLLQPNRLLNYSRVQFISCIKKIKNKKTK